MVDEERLVSLSRELVNRPSENPPGDEKEVTEFLVNTLENSTVDFVIETYEALPDRSNLIASVENGDGPTILLTGHTDVVPANENDWTSNPFSLTERNGRLVGRGIVDMKGAIAAMIAAAEDFYSEGGDGNVKLAFVVDEEQGGTGTEELVKRGIHADMAILGEPTNLNVGIAQKGANRYHLTFSGQSAHSGTPVAGINAIEGMRQALNRIHELDIERRAESSHELLTPESLTVTEVEGGQAPNMVPSKAMATLDWRINPGSPGPDQCDNLLRNAIGDLDSHNKRVDLTINRILTGRPCEIPFDHPLVKTAIRSAKNCGIDSNPVGFNAATDARFLINDANIPTILFGPGSISDDAHTVDESVSRADLISVYRFYREFLSQALA